MTNKFTYVQYFPSLKLRIRDFMSYDGNVGGITSILRLLTRKYMGGPSVPLSGGFCLLT